MQCPGCGFENLPGQANCARCRARLAVDAAAGPATFRPPRATPWAKRVRPLLYAWNRFSDRRPVRIPEWLRRLFPDCTLPAGATLRMAASAILPGWGQYLDGRRPQALGFAGAWLLLLFIILNFITRWWNGLLIGLLLSLHAAAIFDAVPLGPRLPELPRRLQAMLLILCLLIPPYLIIGFNLGAATGLRLAITPGDCPAAGLHRDDVLLLRRLAPGAPAPRPGDVVSTTDTRNFWISHDGRQAGGRPDYYPNYAYRFEYRPELPLWIVARAGEELRLTAAGIQAGRRWLPRERLPAVPLPSPESPPVVLAVPDGYSMAIATTLRENNQQLPTSPEGVTAFWKQAFLFQTSQLQYRAVAVYLPLSHRHILHPSPETP